MSATEQPGVEFFDLGDFTFQDGTSMNARLAYRDFNKDAKKVALIPTCFRGRTGSTLNFAKGALRDYRVIVVALFGNGESSSPSNSPDGVFPKSLDYRDCVRAQHELVVKHLGLSSLDVIVGFSMGGQCTYYWTAMFPDFVRNAVMICSSARTSRHNFQFLEGPRAGLENSADYVPGLKAAGSGQTASKGMQAFGKAYSAWLTSAQWFDQELYKQLGFQSLEAWDKVTTEVNYRDWAPDDLLVMLGMWQRGDVTVCKPASNGSLEAALPQIKSRVLLMPCRTDQYFSWEASEREAALLPAAKLEIVPSVWGHIAGGGANPTDIDWMEGRISAFLAEGS